MKDKSKSSLQWNSNSLKKKKNITIKLNKNRRIQKDIVYKGKNKHINLARNIA